MKRGQIDPPPPEKTTLKKPSLLSVNPDPTKTSPGSHVYLQNTKTKLFAVGLS